MLKIIINGRIAQHTLYSKIRFMLLSLFLSLALSIHAIPVWAANRLTVLSAIAGNFTDPFGGGTIEVTYLSSGTDISTDIDWSIEYSVKDGCGGVLEFDVPFVPASPAKINIFSSGPIPIGVYTYRIKAHNPLDGTTADLYSKYYIITVKDPINLAPVVNSLENIDTTLSVGLNSLSHLEFIGAVVDACTDVLTIKWEQLEGPTLQNYDGGNGLLVLQDAPAGTYTFRLSAKDDGDLSAETTMRVYIRETANAELVLMKAFSPNEDGIDDTWNIGNISTNGSRYSVTIINQHGNVILESKPPYANDVVWDGTQFGKPLPEGAYYFIVTNHDTRETKRGSILMVK